MKEEFVPFNVVFDRGGRFHGNILSCLNGYIYIRMRSVNDGMIEFRCARYHKGCQVRILTNHTIHKKYHLRVFWQSSSHTHPPSLESYKRERRIISITEVWDSLFP